MENSSQRFLEELSSDGEGLCRTVASGVDASVLIVGAQFLLARACREGRGAASVLDSFVGKLEESLSTRARAIAALGASGRDDRHPWQKGLDTGALAVAGGGGELQWQFRRRVRRTGVSMEEGDGVWKVVSAEAGLGGKEMLSSVGIDPSPLIRGESGRSILSTNTDKDHQGGGGEEGEEEVTGDAVGAMVELSVRQWLSGTEGSETHSVFRVVMFAPRAMAELLTVGEAMEGVVGDDGKILLHVGKSDGDVDDSGSSSGGGGGGGGGERDEEWTEARMVREITGNGRAWVRVLGASGESEIPPLGGLDDDGPMTMVRAAAKLTEATRKLAAAAASAMPTVGSPAFRLWQQEAAKQSSTRIIRDTRVVVVEKKEAEEVVEEADGKEEEEDGINTSGAVSGGSGAGISGDEDHGGEGEDQEGRGGGAAGGERAATEPSTSSRVADTPPRRPEARVHTVSGEVEDVVEDVEDHGPSRSQEEDEGGTVAGDPPSLERREEELEKGKRELEEEKAEFERKREEFDRTMAKAEEELQKGRKALEEEGERLGREKEDVEAARKRLEKDIEAWKEKKPTSSEEEGWEKEREELEKARRDVEVTRKEVEEARARLEKDIEAWKEKKPTSSEEEGWEKEKEELETERTKVESALKQLEEQKTQVKAEKEDMERERRELEETKASVERQQSELDTQRAAIQVQEEAIAARSAELEKEKSEVERVRAETEEKMEELEKREEEVKKEKDALMHEKELMMEAKESTASGPEEDESETGERGRDGDDGDDREEVEEEGDTEAKENKEVEDEEEEEKGERKKIKVEKGEEEMSGHSPEGKGGGGDDVVVEREASSFGDLEKRLLAAEERANVAEDELHQLRGAMVGRLRELRLEKVRCVQALEEAATLRKQLRRYVSGGSGGGGGGVLPAIPEGGRSGVDGRGDGGRRGGGMGIGGGGFRVRDQARLELFKEETERLRDRIIHLTREKDDLLVEVQVQRRAAAAAAEALQQGYAAWRGAPPGALTSAGYGGAHGFVPAPPLHGRTSSESSAIRGELRALRKALQRTNRRRGERGGKVDDCDDGGEYDDDGGDGGEYEGGRDDDEEFPFGDGDDDDDDDDAERGEDDGSRGRRMVEGRVIRELRAKIRRLQRAKGSKGGESSAKLKELQKEKEELETELTAAKKQIAELEEDKARAEKERDEALRGFDEAKRAVSDKEDATNAAIADSREKIQDLEEQLKVKDETIKRLEELPTSLTPDGEEGTLLRKLQESEKAQVEALSKATVLDGELQNYRTFMERTMARHKRQLAAAKKKK